jgi:hypothetical protein
VRVRARDGPVQGVGCDAIARPTTRPQDALMPRTNNRPA